MDSKFNFKKLLCYNIVNNCKCVYKNKCMFAHTLEEQKKEPLRQFIYNMLYVWDDLSNINVCDDTNLMDELLIMTKECKNCINKKCPGGYNCKFGVCVRENKICYNDLMYGKCYNMLMEKNHNGMIIYKCIHGIHLTEKKLIPHNQRMLSDLNALETNFFIKHNMNFNSKNNIISIGLNDYTIELAKDIISNKMSKLDVINNLKITNKIFYGNDKDDVDDDIFENILSENFSYDDDNANTNANANANVNANANANTDINDNMSNITLKKINYDGNFNLNLNNIVIYDDDDNIILQSQSQSQSQL